MRAAGLVLLFLLPAALEAQRVRDGNRIISAERPKATLEVAPGMVYAGTQRFELYGVADAEQHFFVELDGTRLKRLLWIQYEGYHPSNTNTYNYSDETVTHSGRTWFRRVSTVKIPETESRPESDGARARAFLKARGWSIGPEVMLERLVWILDSPARNELMIIYMEDLVGHRETAVEAFHQRATAAFVIQDR